MQTIFSSNFIEQTKGWSEFFASIPYFGISKNKEKVFEFLLDLKELSVALTKDELDKQEKLLKANWDRKIERCELLASEYNAKFISDLDSITIDPDSLNLLSLNVFDHDIDGKEVPLRTLIEEYESEVWRLNEIPILKVEQNKEHIRAQLEELYKKQSDFSIQYNEFTETLNIQRTQYNILKEHLQSVSRELSSQKGIQNIIDEAIVVEDVYNKCPTCRQSVSDDLMAQEGVTIEKLTLNENIAYLTGQHQIISSSLNSLEKIIEEKQLIKKYYIKNQEN
ncbi:hypothetical protein OKW96_14930 [Sphingobacterium sp. KU25419]|nr:hypothetical protein OKW96_14930 [Sphingobacterium sp. KU25419]